MIFNNEKTRLQKGDMIAYNEDTGMIMFFRNNQPLLFSNGSAEVFLYMRDLKFLVLIKILAETNGLDCPSSMQEIEPHPLIIGKRKWLSYIF